jgi:hypothetical protein
MMPTRDAREEKRRMQKYNDPHIRIFVLLNVCFSSALGDIDDNFIIYELVCTSIPVSRKKILTITHPDTLFFEHFGTGSFVQTSTHAYWSDPTQSACCDDSQLLLGLTPACLRGPPIEDYPRHNRLPCVRKFGSAVNCMYKCTSNPISTSLQLRITSYRLP